jgi:hypothetical protein
MFEMILANLERKIRGYSHTLRLFSKGVSRTFAQTPDICGTRVHRLAAAFAALRFLCSTSSSFIGSVTSICLATTGSMFSTKVCRTKLWFAAIATPFYHRQTVSSHPKFVL